MDSGNSGSLQSSSGGDEEYDPRTESISAFLNPSSHVASLSNPSHHHQTHPPQPPPPSSSSLFDYLDSYSRSPAAPPNASSLLNLDMVWPRGLRSEPTCTEIPTGGLMGSSSPAQPAPGSQAGPFLGSSPTMPLYTSAKNGATARPSASSSSDQPNPVRNSKKRSRASRRAPTTVLTTDTSNFRAMVQEFTGIPAPPFSASPFPRNRFDLFSTASRSSHLDPPPPPYLLRPFAQKFHAPSFASSSLASTTSNASVTTSAAATTTVVGSTNNHQLLPDLGFTKQTQSLINMQNPIFTFQSLLQTSGPPPTAPPPRYPLANVPVFGSKPQGSLTMVEEFTMGSHGLPSLVNNNNNNSSSDPSRWGDGMGLNDGDQSQSQSQLKSFNGNYSSSQQQRGSSSCKMNYSTSGLEFQVEKGSENVSSRGEGMVDSWICSSD